VALVAILAVAIGGALRVGLGFVDPLAGALLGLGFAAFIGLAIVLVIKILSILPRFLHWTGIAAAGVFITCMFMMRFPPHIALALGLGIVFVEAALGGALSFVRSSGLRGSSTWRKALIAAAIVLAVAVNLFLIYWLASDGKSEHLQHAESSNLQIPALDAPDPSRPGGYNVSFMTYGSGDNHRRPEFGEKADLETDTVDGGPLLDENEGWRVKVREWFWGFDLEHLPVNGQVWYPEGEGSFPLILIVHGNHDMAEYSDPGYGYLGELFASRGIITVSVDENFLNGSWVGGLKKENDARGWMLLQHLKVWREWNRKKGNPFFGKVDMENIGLIGHSRGGEAVYVAGAFNRLKHYPDDATVEFDFGFNIRGIISIAPVDGQYKPTGRRTPLQNVNYLVLQGGHDADVSQFAGKRLYERLRFTDGGYWFKASLFTYRANHGQFNTVWGRTDMSWPVSMLLNLEPLLDGDDQRQVGKVYMSAFFETTLHRDERYLPMFRDHRRISDWLPEDAYITCYEDSQFRRIADYEEDIDVTTATLEGATISGNRLAVWREQDLELRKSGTKEDQAAYIGWRPREEDPSEEPATYAVTLPEGLGTEWDIDVDSAVVFSLADADEEVPEPDDEDEDEEVEEDEDEEQDEDEDKEEEPPDLTIEIMTRHGVSVGLPLSLFRSVTPVLRSRFTKFWDEEKLYGDDYERTLQRYELPLSEFIQSNPEIDPKNIETIRFVFDRTEKGVIILDDIGFSR
jgi:hypothetical protein